jgi:hypothetical protein
MVINLIFGFVLLKSVINQNIRLTLSHPACSVGTLAVSLVEDEMLNLNGF